MIQQQNRESIREAVDRLVRSVGFDKMTIRQICAEAGVSTGTFYYNFRSKDDLLADRYVRTERHFAALYEEKLRHMPPLEALKAYAADYVAYGQSRVLAMLTQYMKVAISEHRRWQRENGPREDIARLLFEHAQAAGEIRSDRSPAQLAYALSAMLTGISYLRCMSEDEMGEDHCARDAVLEWLEGMRVSPIAQSKYRSEKGSSLSE